MADYWKSNPRKFCEFCQCWYADNKSSKEFHERGKRHKENVEKKIGELRKKGQKQYETQQQLSGFLKQMEEDAMKAFKKDVASNPDLIPEYKVALVENRVRQQLEDPTAVQGSRFQAGQSGGPSGTQGTTPSSSSTQAQQEWVEAVSPEGYTYYWNTKTGVTQWDKPANFTSLSSSSSQDKGSSNKKVEEKEDSDEDNEKGEEKEEEEKNTEESENTSRGTKRKNDAYGGWTTVSTEPEEEPDLQLPEANPLYMSSYVPQAAQYEPREKLEIQEKKVGSIKASSREASGSVSFKKRKGGQRQIRSRDSTS